MKVYECYSEIKCRWTNYLVSEMMEQLVTAHTVN